MAEGLDFSALWPVPAGRFGWSARASTPCVMEIVSWLTVGAFDTTWPGVSPCIADYVQAVQDALDDEARQKLLVLVPALMNCASADDGSDIESARRVLLAERSLSRLVPLVLEAAGWRQEAEVVRESGGSFARLRGPLHEAAEYVPVNPFVTSMMECAQKLVACADDGHAAKQAQMLFHTAQLAVSVIQCNDAKIEYRTMLGGSLSPTPTARMVLSQA
jgi:hypothetical protein